MRFIFLDIVLLNIFHSDKLVRVSAQEATETRFKFSCKVAVKHSPI